VQLHGPGAGRGGVDDLEMAGALPAGEEPVAAGEGGFEPAEVADAQRSGAEGRGEDEKERDVDEIEIVHVGFEEKPEEQYDDQQAVARGALPDAFTYRPERA